jgi:hypothetical protein
MLRYLLIIWLCLTATIVCAQSNLKGKVFENKTRIGLANVWVENLNSKRNAFSDKSGNFTIPAKNGDLILFKGFAYKNDTLLVTGANNIEVFLDPQQIALDQVNVTTTEIVKMNTYYDPQFHGQPVVYHRDSKGNYDGGVTLRMWYWKKGEKDKAKLDKKLKDFDTMDRIHGVFTPQIIGKYVPLTGEDMDTFIALYTPSVKVFSKRDFNLAQYLNDSYKQYLALPPEKRKIQPFIE